ncbi:sigma-54-dependent transcriptional regulator [Lichenicoccus sp.]|uniref:sigma-54-dependent transcriptional regulator n=1 Tax=Lichenicoccus sp. TaxID=2781899 RepID=UPI003D0E4ED5
MSQTLSSPASAPPRVLFVDDDADVQKSAALLLPRRGFGLLQARSPDEAFSLLAERPVDVVLLDLNFGPGATTGAEGLATLERLLAHEPDLVVVVVTGHSGVAIAVAAMRAGAADFVMKPWSNERLLATLSDAAALRRRRSRPVAGAQAETPLIGDSPAMRRVLDQAARIALTDASLVLLGEAGTGKSLLARTIHRLSPRSGRTLHVLDAAALGESGLDAALAPLDDSDTLLIEEVSALPMALQRRLLDRLQSHPALRVITTSRRDRSTLHAALLPDLLDRLGAVELLLPPLRQRGDDARRLAEHALRRAALRHRLGALSLSDAALAALAAGHFADNLRGLLRAVEQAALLAPLLARDGVIEAHDIPVPASVSEAVAPPGEGDLHLRRSEKALVQAALRRHGFNVSHAARELGLTRAALYRRMARHGL